MSGPKVFQHNMALQQYDHSYELHMSVVLMLWLIGKYCLHFCFQSTGECGEKQQSPNGSGCTFSAVLLVLDDI